MKFLGKLSHPYTYTLYAWCPFYGTKAKSTYPDKTPPIAAYGRGIYCNDYAYKMFN